jgi:anti-anti-sigma factor
VPSLDPAWDDPRGVPIKAMYSSGEPISITEALLRVPYGQTSEEHFFNCTFQPMRDPGGEIEGVTGHMIDVTELVRARSELEAVAAERAGLYLQEHEIAETLQRSLLPERLPELRGLALAARYLPGSAGIDVGGDWYDVFPMPTGRIGLVVGDVIGRGLKAAAAMGQLRIALRAYALDADDPAEVLARLSGLLADLRDVEMATVFFGIVDYGHHSFRFASAGHPAPLLVKPDGEAVFLEGGRRPPLGVQMKGEAAATAALEPGSTLLLYSDGLIESRDRSIDDGMTALRKLTAHSNLDVEELCDLVIDNLATGSSDDVALLALRTSTTLDEGLTLTVPSEPRALTAARRALGQWFQRVGAGTQEAEDLVLACNEAIANAISHAYGPRTGSVLVEAELVEDRVLITVSDQGLWEHERARERGRGFQLMRSLVDRLEVERSASGTAVRMARRLGGSREDRADEVEFVDAARPEPAVKAGLIPVAHIREEIDLDNAARIGQELDRLVSEAAAGLVVDLSGVGFMDSAGLRVLFRLAEDLARNSQRLAVVAPEGTSVRDTLNLVLFESVARVVGNVESAKEALGGEPAADV